MKTLNIFYEEPNSDRWFKQKRGGVMMFALQLMQGLDKLNIPYRFNDFSYAKKHPEECVCIIGKPHLLFNRQWKNPILFGPGTYSHPTDCTDLFTKYPNVKKFIVACDWMKGMFSPYYKEENIVIWPVGIDTTKWHPTIKSSEQPIDFLIYDKIRWEHAYYEKQLISPLINKLKSKNLTYDVIKYGSYTHDILIQKLSRCKSVIFLCEHETQGLAYQQILSTNTPILAWDREGYWQDPAYYPDKVKYEPVNSVPYWSDICGMKFKNIDTFESVLSSYLKKKSQNYFAPRNFILENLTLEISARKYYDLVDALSESI